MTSSFVDTNVLVYAASLDPTKSSTAGSVIAAGGRTSVQVLNEFVDVMRRKFKMSWGEIATALDLTRSALTVSPMSLAAQEHAVELAARYQFRIFDAAIIASAVEGGCDTLYTEDMHHGLVVENRLTIVNPFA